MLLGSIEAGGTKFICSVGDERLKIINQTRIETTTPEVTLSQVINYFSQFPELASVSIASFGPLNLDHHSDQFGAITNTPKLGWQGVNMFKLIRDALAVPVSITSDVNGSALGESYLLHQNGIEHQSLVYITVGTGIGAGIVINDHIFGLNGHPELGHIKVVRHSGDGDFHGTCPFHDDCLEGLAAGPSFKARTNTPGERIPHTDPIWQRIAFYLAQAAVTTTLMIHPDKIVFGGSVINDDLIQMIRREYQTLMNGYVEAKSLVDYLSVSCAHDNNSATIGNLILATDN
ncbi:ROK family protein (plasmid) [Nicoliella spurrieriana]|uniref:fructokinase n=1 Tax=Nicoliella spurrieriana TaxID=2925830 RepID=A0A976RQP2_9LACO|nr:ROK family protein [Nicoliella spurrieriana]UQS85987.1 ROK family protein [Nicoliella spurrieriana]